MNIQELLVQVKKEDGMGYYKWVRVGREYRFTLHRINHSTLLQPGEKAQAAGFVGVMDGEMSVRDGGSTTLKVNPAPEDPARLAELWKQVWESGEAEKL